MSIGLHESLLLKVNTFLNEHSGHSNQVFVGAEVFSLNFVEIMAEAVLGTSHYTKVWISLL